MASSSNLEDKELECPVCFEIPKETIYQCKNGHMICGSCSSEVQLCPQCRCDLKVEGGLIRNRFAESLVAKLKIPLSTSAQKAQKSVTQTVSEKVPAQRATVGDIRQTGSGDQKFEGNIKGNVSQNGSGSLKIHGDVDGSVCQLGSGTLKIIGNVQGKVSQNGSGDLYLKMDVHGDISQMGCGTLKVYGNVKGNVSQCGSGDIYIFGDVYGVISKTGSGDIITKGSRYTKK